MSVYHKNSQCLCRSEETGVRPPGTGVTVDCELHFGYRDSNLDLLKLLIMETSVKPQYQTFNMTFSMSNAGPVFFMDVLGWGLYTIMLDRLFIDLILKMTFCKMATWLRNTEPVPSGLL